MGYDVVCGDVLDWAAGYAGPPFMAAFCDPPYELNFMGKAWDKSGVAFQPDTWAALAAHLLPGAFLMAFGGSRTYHRLACAVEDAGLILHPAISYLFGSGFPKATNIHNQQLARAFDAISQGVLRSIQTVGDFLDDYPKRCRFCGGPLQQVEVAFQGGVPLSGDAQEHSHFSGPSIDIQVDNVQIRTQLGRLFFRLSKPYSLLPSWKGQTGDVSAASTGRGIVQSSAGEIRGLASDLSGDMSGHNSESKTHQGYEHEPPPAQTVSRNSGNAPEHAPSLWTETHQSMDGNRNGDPSLGQPPHGGNGHDTGHTLTSEADDRCIPCLTIEPTSNTPPGLIYSHLTIGCVNCQIEAFEQAGNFSGHRYGLQALKPAAEFILVAQKPYAGRSVDSITRTGAGALNIERSRVRQNCPYQDADEFSCIPRFWLDILDLDDVCGHTHVFRFDEHPDMQPSELISCPDSSGDNGHLSHERVLDALRCISFALGYYNTVGTTPAHDGDDLDGKRPDRAECEFLQSRLFPNGAWCGLVLIQALDSLGGCQACHHLYDGLLHDTQEAAQDGAPSLAYALERIASALLEPLRNPCSHSDHLSSVGALALALALVNLLSGTLISDTIPQLARQRKLTTRKSNKFSGTFRDDGYVRQDQEYADAHPAGRWPSNVLLSHVPPDADGNGGCRRVGTRRVQSNERKRKGIAGRPKFSNGKYHEYDNAIDQTNADADGRETVEAWECEAGCAVAELAAQSGDKMHPAGNKQLTRCTITENQIYEGGWKSQIKNPDYYGDQGTAARFFYQADFSLDVAERLAGVAPFWYCAKSSRAERDKGLEGFEAKVSYRHNHNGRDMTKVSNAMGDAERRRVARGEPGIKPSRNHHPCIKPLSLTRYLATLLLPPAAYAPRRILVPFAGSGSEMIGALLAGWEDVLGIEQSPEYVDIAQARLAYWAAQAVQAEMAL